MKTFLLTFVVFSAAIAALHAAEPVVVVQSVTSVTVDGINFGKPADTIANNPKLASVVQIALEKWAAQVVAERAAAEAELAQIKVRIDSTLQGLLIEELKTGEGPRATLLRKLIAEAGKSDAQLKREQLEAQAAELQKQIEALPPK